MHKTKIKRQDTSNLLQTANKVDTLTNVLGLVNGMISTTILVLPTIGITTGFLTSIILCAVFGFICYYTAYLLVVHIGEQKMPHIFVLIHFQNDHKYLVLINFLVWLGYIPTFIIFIKIICLTTNAILGYESQWTGPIVAGSLVAIIIIIRMFYLGEKTLAYGIFSIVAYGAFLVWAQLRAPEGPKQLKQFGEPMDMSAFLIMAYTVHSYMPMNVLKNPLREQYHTAMRYTFLIGSLLYMFVSLGSFAIINRHSYVKNPQTISDYFHSGQWQVIFIQVINILHIISTLPNFMIASKIRFFQMFKISIKRHINVNEVIYVICMIGGCYVLFATGINLHTLIVVDGAVIKFISVIIIPIWIHFKCVFYDRSSGYILNDQERNQSIEENQCQCKLVYKSKWALYVETAFLVFIMLIGLALMLYISLQIS